MVAKDIINNLNQRTFEVDIFYVKESQSKLDFNYKLSKVSLFQKIDFSAYSIVHSHGFLGDLFVFLNRSRLKTKWITTIHQFIRPNYGMNYNPLTGYVLEEIWCYLIKFSDCIVTLTKDMTKYYTNRLKNNVITYAYNGITPSRKILPADDPDKNLIISLKSKYKVLGISANVTYLKGIDQVIRSLAQPKGSQLCLIVFGDGPDKEKFKKMAESLNVSDRCLFVGFKANAIDYFQYFDIYMMSSRSEGFGLCVLEAASEKIPVVCNDLPVYREIFQDEVIRFQLNDLNSLLDAVNFCLQIKDQQSLKIHNWYLKNFTAQAMSARYAKIYQHTAPSHGS